METHILPNFEQARPIYIRIVKKITSDFLFVFFRNVSLVYRFQLLLKGETFKSPIYFDSAQFLINSYYELSYTADVQGPCDQYVTGIYIRIGNQFRPISHSERCQFWSRWLSYPMIRHIFGKSIYYALNYASRNLQDNLQRRERQVWISITINYP